MATVGRHLVAGLALAIVASGHASAAPPQRLLLQQITPHSAIVKWRGDAQVVCYSKQIEDVGKPNWPHCAGAIDHEGHKVAHLSGLAPQQSYYYSVGGIAGEQQKFETPPNANKPPKDGNTRIWVSGDSGTAGLANRQGQAAAVAEGFRKFVRASGEPADLVLTLGDTAYDAGTDAQWQVAFFDVYADLLKQAQVLPTIGNHEMGYAPFRLCVFDPSVPCSVLVPLGGVSTSSDPNSYDGNKDAVPDGSGAPYLSIFSLPTQGEAGGVPSGTELYYSADYANVHVVSLDSQVSARDPDKRAAMRNWLIADLAANTRDWTVVIFHHPPYTKGANHDSDDAANDGSVDRPEWDIRNEFTQIFEQHGVDVVFSGHSHSYERSYYLRGHRGTSDTFSVAAHAELNASGQGALGKGTDGPYAQLSPTSGGVDDRVVYVVAGSSGQADAGAAGNITTPAEWLRHPAHIVQPADPLGRNGLARLGSVVLDASAHRLVSRFIDVDGQVLDEFTVTR